MLDLFSANLGIVRLISPLHAARKLRIRARQTGVSATLRYLLGMYLLPLLGIQIKFIYTRPDCDAARDDSLPPIKGFDFLVLSELRAFSPKLVDQIAHVSPDQTPQVCKSYALAGRICVLAADQRSVVHAMLWLQPSPEYLGSKRGDYVLVRDVATATASRGKGIAPRLIRAALTTLPREAHRQPVTFVANSVFTNTASMRMLEKAGFRRSGFSASFLGRGIAHWRTAETVHTNLYGKHT